MTVRPWAAAYEVAFELLGIAGAGLCLIGGDHHHVVVSSTDPVVQERGNLQVHPAVRSAQHRGGLDDRGGPARTRSGLVDGWSTAA